VNKQIEPSLVTNTPLKWLLQKAGLCHRIREHGAGALGLASNRLICDVWRLRYQSFTRNLPAPNAVERTASSVGAAL
jgi:hypothetical protein